MLRSWVNPSITWTDKICYTQHSVALNYKSEQLKVKSTKEIHEYKKNLRNTKRWPPILDAWTIHTHTVLIRKILLPNLTWKFKFGAYIFIGSLSYWKEGGDIHFRRQPTLRLRKSSFPAGGRPSACEDILFFNPLPIGEACGHLHIAILIWLTHAWNIKCWRTKTITHIACKLRDEFFKSNYVMIWPYGEYLLMTD